MIASIPARSSNFLGSKPPPAVYLPDIHARILAPVYLSCPRCRGGKMFEKMPPDFFRTLRSFIRVWICQTCGGRAVASLFDMPTWKDVRGKSRDGLF